MEDLVTPGGEDAKVCLNWNEMIVTSNLASFPGYVGVGGVNGNLERKQVGGVWQHAGWTAV